MVEPLETRALLAVDQTFFIPFPENEVDIANEVLNTTNDTVHTDIGIVARADGTIIYYDHWEDGFEADIESPVQATTEIWGDGNPANGIPPGFGSDIVDAGAVILLANDVPVNPRNAASVFFDSPDKVGSVGVINISKLSYNTSPGSVLAGAAQAFDTTRWGTSFVSPIGEDVPSNSIFQYTSLFVTAAEDNTDVDIDTDGNGSVDISVTLNEGEQYFVNGGIEQGATVDATEPVQAFLLTGDVGANWESRWFELVPSTRWSDEYFTPVGSRTRGSTQNTDVWVYNPNAVSITVNALTTSGTTPLVIPAGSHNRFTMPVNSGAQFTSTGGENFFALTTIDSDPTGNLTFDWGFSLIPTTFLTPELLIPLGLGTENLTANTSPLWVTAAEATTLYIDFDGDPSTGAMMDPLGNFYDQDVMIAAFEPAIILDPDNDASGARIYSTEGTLITGAWGQDPSTASFGFPALDLGTTLLPSPVPYINKEAMLVVDNNGNMLVDPGDTLEYSLNVRNTGLVDATNVIVTDDLPAGVTYVPSTTTLEGLPIPDDGVGTPFPLDGAGYNIGTVNIFDARLLTYRVVVDSLWDLSADSIDNVAEADSTDFQEPVEDFNITPVVLPMDPGVLGDKVWFDADGDGIQDPGEPGLSGVEITASVDVDSDTVPDFFLTVTTDANGCWTMTDMPFGDYTVTLDPGTLPPGFTTQSGDPDGTNDNMTMLTLSGGMPENNDVDFGYHGDGSIGDTVFLDIDGDNLPDTGEGIAGVTLEIMFDFDGDGTDETLSVVTAADGTYLFPGLPTEDAGGGPVTYPVSVNTATLPAGAMQTFDPDGTLDDMTDITISNATPTDLTADFGYQANGMIGDRIFADSNTNGMWDAGEGIENVDVTLVGDFDGDGTDDTLMATTGPDGFYKFTGLPTNDGTGAGVPYTITVDTSGFPAGAVPTVDPDGVLDNMTTVTLTDANDMRLDMDFGYNDPAMFTIVKNGDAAAGFGDTVTFDVTVDFTPGFGGGGIITSVEDDVYGTASPVLSGGFNVGDTNMNNLIESTETWQYEVSGVVNGPVDDNCQITNTVTVTGTDEGGGAIPDAMDSHTQTITHVFRYDFNAPSDVTAATYEGVAPGQTYPTNGAGWDSIPDWATFDRLAPDDLLRDGHYGWEYTSGTFRVDVLPGTDPAPLTYQVTVTFGDLDFRHDHQRMTVSSDEDPGTTILSNAQAGTWTTEVFNVQVGDSGQIELLIENLGGNHNWVINALDIRLLDSMCSDAVIPITLTRTDPVGGDPLEADGATVDTYSGSGAPANALLTITASGGAITSTDDSAIYNGVQVTADGAGNFSFTLQRPSGDDDVMVMAAEISGLATGTFTQTYRVADVRRFDMNASGSPTGSGFVGVRRDETYNTANGYGWLDQPIERDRGAASSDVRRDIHYGIDDTFQIEVVPGTAYDLRLYLGDPDVRHADIEVYVEGVLQTTVTTDAGAFNVDPLLGLSSADDILEIRLVDTGAPEYFSVAALDIALAGTLPGTAPLQAVGQNWSDPLGVRSISHDDLTPIVEEATHRWALAGQDTSVLTGVNFEIVDLPNAYLAMADTLSDTIFVDTDAAGWGWFVDETPHEDSEFFGPRVTVEGMDLLTVLLHDIGHMFGLEDEDPSEFSDNIMVATLSTGIRRSPDITQMEARTPDTPTLHGTADATWNPRPLFGWDPSSYAVQWNLKVVSLTSGDVVLRETGLIDTGFRPAERLADGRYQVRVRAGNAEGRWSGWSSPEDLTVNDRVDLVDGVLQVTGTDGADVIVIDEVSGSVEVTLNGVTTTYVGTDVVTLHVTGGAGDDVLRRSGDSIRAAVLLGNDGSDTITGGTGPDWIVGHQGDDLLSGGDQADTLKGGAGHDRLLGGPGDDRVFGASGDDVLLAEAGDDILWGGAGRDQVHGGSGNDAVWGQHGRDHVFGGTGNDSAYGGAGDDLVSGETGDDRIRGGEGHDLLLGEGGSDDIGGGDGRDLLIGGTGSDALRGEAADDVLITGFTSLSTTELESVWREWRSRRTYGKRVANIRDGSGSRNRANEDAFLTTGVTVFDDGESDQPTGGTADRDWFFANFAEDQPSDRDEFEDLHLL